MRHVLVIAALLIATAPPPVAGQSKVVFVVNKANVIDSLSTAKLKAIFLGKMSHWPGGAEIIPIDLPDNSPPKQAVIMSVLETTPDKLAQYWIEQKLTGNINPPMKLPGVGAVKSVVALRPGAIAYIPIEAVDNTVKILKAQ
jgi:ABC-type phosphate transport system substrate-binding protein